MTITFLFIILFNHWGLRSKVDLIRSEEYTISFIHCLNNHMNRAHLSNMKALYIFHLENGWGFFLSAVSQVFLASPGCENKQ